MVFTTYEIDMSNHYTDILQEDLMDEFYDDVDLCRDWLYSKGVVTSGLSDTELCDLFVEYSLAAMQ